MSVPTAVGAACPGEVFDPLSPSMLADPYLVYERLRTEDPVHWHEHLRAWVLTRHEDCAGVLRRPEVFGSDPRKLAKPIPESVISLQTMDPPEHSAVRHHFLAKLRRQDLDAWSARVRRIAGELLANAGPDSFDLVAGVAEPLALHSMCLLCGVPFPDDDERFRTASRTMVLGMDAGLEPARREPALAARGVLNEIIEDWIARAPRESLISGLDEVSGIERGYLVNSARAVFDAGYSTTGNLLGNIVKWLLGPGGVRDTAPLGGLDSRAVEELGRVEGVVQAVSRHCLADVEIGGRALRRGDVVIVMLAAANHDPKVFPDPRRADFSRESGPHLVFGRGVHSCLGGHVAGRIALALLHALAEGFERIEPAGPHRQRPTATQRGLDYLPIRLS
ncbi:cytochrome P450 [Saccharopolyspora erythraea]|uniref:cytochrome P450 n=1 Tax=Saccharopolyspora erythraea TaxID=1836 RepID=UPI001BA79F4C|nr:cytochrome P450 [Saccharopolyspora erythraea]QUH04558.1 cytochrome P450 [Saccharopolyspora erythraea]